MVRQPVNVVHRATVRMSEKPDCKRRKFDAVCSFFHLYGSRSGTVFALQLFDLLVNGLYSTCSRVLAQFGDAHKLEVAFVFHPVVSGKSVAAATCCSRISDLLQPARATGTKKRLQNQERGAQSLWPSATAACTSGLAPRDWLQLPDESPLLSVLLASSTVPGQAIETQPKLRAAGGRNISSQSGGLIRTDTPPGKR